MMKILSLLIAVSNVQALRPGVEIAAESTFAARSVSPPIDSLIKLMNHSNFFNTKTILVLFL